MTLSGEVAFDRLDPALVSRVLDFDTLNGDDEFGIRIVPVGKEPKTDHRNGGVSLDKKFEVSFCIRSGVILFAEQGRHRVVSHRTDRTAIR